MCVCVGLCMCVNESESLGVTVFLQVSEDALRTFHGLTDELFSSSLFAYSAGKAEIQQLAYRIPLPYITSYMYW